VAAVLLSLSLFATATISSLGSGGGVASPGSSPEVIAGTDVEGTLAFGRAGSIFGVSGGELRALTAGSTDREIAWGDGGRWLYFVRHRDADGGVRTASGGIQKYRLVIPTLLRIGVLGGGEEQLLDGLIPGDQPTLDWSAFIFDPAPAPDGTIALATDLKDGRAGRAVVIRLLTGSSVVTPDLPVQIPYGHQDPAWSPDGTVLYYVQNGITSDGSASRLIRYDLASRSVARLGERGLIEPAPSPDGRWIAATRITAKGSDVVILDAATGQVALEVTRGGRSWSPAWSPDGSRLAFLAPRGSDATLEVAALQRSSTGLLSVLSISSILRDPVDADVRPAWGALGPTTSGASPSP
jgi:DNA-binding beta-propeller fold protein YncE